MIDEAQLAEIQPAFDVTYTGADAIAANLAAWRYLAILASGFVLIICLMPIIFIIIDGYSLAEAFEATDWAFTIGATVIVIAFIVLLSVAKHWWRKLRGENGPISFVMKPEGVSFRNRIMDGVVFWNAIRRVHVRGQRIFLFLNNRSALIIPRRVFTSDEQFERFAKTARDRWEQDRSKEVAG